MFKHNQIKIHAFSHATEDNTSVTPKHKRATYRNFKPRTKIIAAKISRVIGMLHKLKYIFPAYLLRMIYNSLILPHLNHSLLAWGTHCPNIELLQKKAVRVVNFKSPVRAHTEPILKGMNQLKLPDMHIYTCQLLKLYYKLFRNKLPAYFVSQHNLRNNCIRLPAIRCEFGKLNTKYQMHFRLRELANPSNPPLYPNMMYPNDVTTRSLTGFSKHIKSKFISCYSLHCDIGECYAAITLIFHIFYPAVCAHVHSITCCHLELFAPNICNSHCTVQICITNKLHDYIVWSHLMLCC